ncbi:unnamed protein product, partial [Closterium sp. NIES-64]
CAPRAVCPGEVQLWPHVLCAHLCPTCCVPICAPRAVCPREVHVHGNAPIIQLVSVTPSPFCPIVNPEAQRNPQPNAAQAPQSNACHLLCAQVNPASVVILEGILVFHDLAMRAHINMTIFVDTLLSSPPGSLTPVPLSPHRATLHRMSLQVNPADVVILEGILVFHDPAVHAHMKMKIFVDTLSPCTPVTACYRMSPASHLPSGEPSGRGDTGGHTGIFVDTDADVRLARRIRRDTVHRGRDVQSVIEQYAKFVKPAFDDFVLPTKKFADIIIPRGGDNHVAVDLIVQHIRTKLGQHDLRKIYSNVFVIESTFQVSGKQLIVQHMRTKLGQHDLRKIYSNVFVIESTFQVITAAAQWVSGTAMHLIVQHIRTKTYLNVFVIESPSSIRGMHTLIRNRDTRKHDFVFYADRLIRLVVEHGLGHLPFVEKQARHPHRLHLCWLMPLLPCPVFSDVMIAGIHAVMRTAIHAVMRTAIHAVMRTAMHGAIDNCSGESMENALRACVKGIRLGKILIHREGDDGKECVTKPVHLSPPPPPRTGSSAMKAIETLIAKGVPQSRIIFLNLISGIHNAVPCVPARIKIVTSEIDVAINDHFRVVPGIGEFGDRITSAPMMTTRGAVPMGCRWGIGAAAAAGDPGIRVWM